MSETAKSMFEVYPSIDDLMPHVMLGLIPGALAQEIKERYENLGLKYLTNKRTEDGRWINACMDKSSVQDAREEVIDAVFNTLVWIFKGYKSKDGISPNSYPVLKNLIECYSILLTEKELGDALR